MIGRGEDPFSVPSFADEIADGAWAEAWVPGAREVAEVWADPGILGRELRLPMGVLPGAAAAAVYTHELTVHTWDLARATGQDPDWDPALIERVIGVVRRALPPKPAADGFPSRRWWSWTPRPRPSTGSWPGPGAGPEGPSRAAHLMTL